MPTTKPVKTLKEAKYSFDTSRNTWICGRKPVPEEEVLIHLIRYAKSQNIRHAGDWAESALESAKSDPEITTGTFMKARMVRNRNRRIAGKYLFQNWARAVGIEIPDGTVEAAMRHHQLRTDPAKAPALTHPFFGCRCPFRAAKQRINRISE